MFNVEYNYDPEIAELACYVGYVIPIETKSIGYSPNGGIVFRFGLTPTMQATLEIHRKLREDKNVQQEK